MDDVKHAGEVVACLLQLRLGLRFLRLVLEHSGRFFENAAAIFGLAVEDCFNAALGNKGKGFAAQTAVHEHFHNVAQPHRPFVNQEVTLTTTKQPPGHAHFFRLVLQVTIGVVKGQRDFRPVEGWPLGGPSKNHVPHPFTTKTLGTLFTQCPANGFRDVTLPTTIRADNPGQSVVEFNCSFIRERFETVQVNAFSCIR